MTSGLQSALYLSNALVNMAASLSDSLLHDSLLGQTL